MGSHLFDFLSESFLFQDHLIAEDFASVAVSDVELELSRYREHWRTHEHAVLNEVGPNDSRIRIYNPEGVQVSDLAQAALYVDQYVIQDPLLRFTVRQSDMSKALAFGTVFESPDDEGLNLRSLSQNLALMKTIAPMVAGDFVKFVPDGPLTDAPREIPFYASDNYFEDALPAEILRLFKESAQVSRLEQISPGRARVSKLKPCRHIEIQFKGDLDSHGHLYVLRRIERTALKPGTENEFEMCLTLPDTPPDAAEFQAWVRQSVNQAARRVFDDVCRSASVAAGLDLIHSTSSPLRFEALRCAFKPDTSIPVRKANALLNLDLPYVADMDISRLMQIRRDEGEAFHNFRVSLGQKLIALRDITDSASAEQRASEAARELIDTQLQEVESKMRSVRERFQYSTAGAMVALAAAIQHQGFGLLSAAATLWPFGATVLDYRRDIKRHPAFFLWKTISTKNRGKGRTEQKA